VNYIDISKEYIFLLYDEIIGMTISAKIMFHDEFDNTQRKEVMERIENEFVDVISKYRTLIGLGGKGEWIYKNV